MAEPRDAAQERIDSATRAALIKQLLSAGPITEISHLILITAAVVLVWGRLPDFMIIGWAAAVVGATITRGLVRREAVLRQYDGERALRTTRLSVAAIALAWGVGAAVAMTELPLVQAALLLMLLTGLVAGATTTLTADRPAFLLFIGGIMGPMPVGILANGADREHFFALFLVVFYALFLTSQLNRSHYGLVAYFRAQVLLRDSEATAVRERAYLDALFNSAPVGIVTADLAGVIHRVNPAFERLFGFGAQEVVGRHLDATIVPPEDRESSADMRRRATAGDAVSADLKRRRKDGSLVEVRISANRVVGTGEAELFALYEDVTTQVAARRAIEEARDVAQRAAQARASFLANMSHEIRTPMNAILGFTELLLESELKPEQRHSLSLVQSSAETLLTLIDDILDFSKIEGDHLQLESILFGLPHLVESTAGLLGVRAREKRLEVLAEVATGVPESVRGDPTRLRQVLTNLIGNAIKFTHQGEVVVSVKGLAQDGERARVRFSVRDTGIGIAADKLDTIFAEFSQADASMTRRYGGTGLGLAIARRLVGLMGGELKVESEEGKGSEFFFTLPFEVDTTSAAAAPHPSAAHLAGRRALVVDDSETNRRIVREILTGAGMRVAEVDRGATALETLRRSKEEGKPYDLVILDQQMPDLDGFSVAAAVRANRAIADTRLLMLTSAGQRGDGQRCRELGIRGYMTKPASRSDLLEAAAAVLSASTGMAPDEIVTKHSIAEQRPRMKILLAEDNPVNQEVAATILRRRGHDVDVVGDGRAAVEAVAAKAYDVVLMDIQMPQMDGLEATEAIRATPEGRVLPIIALTAHAQRGERERCLERGMSGYLTKPFKAHELFALVEGWAEETAPAAVPLEPPAAETPRVLDLEAFRRSMREAGAEDAVPSILNTFGSTAPARLADLESAVAALDPKEIQRAAHAYKSAAATIGAHLLAQLLSDLEAAGRTGEISQATAVLAEIRNLHTAVLRELARAS